MIPQRVPDSAVDVFKIGSVAPAALLFDAADAFQSKVCRRLCCCMAGKQTCCRVYAGITHRLGGLLISLRWYSLTQSLTISIWSALCMYADAQDPRADEHIRAISASAPVPASANTVTGATGGAGEEPKPPLEDAIEKCVGAAAALFTIWSH